MLDYSDPDLMHVLKEMADEMQNQSAHNSLHDDVNIQDFMTQLCQSIDSTSFLTPAELLEYETMVEAGDIRYGRELEDSFSEFFPDGLQDIEDEDNCFIIKEIEMANSHINLVTQLQKTLNDEIRYVSSGMHQLEQQKEGAHYNLLSEGRHCAKLNSKVYSAQEELLRQLQGLAELSADFKNVKSVPQLIGQMPLDTYKKRCFQFDHHVKMMMKQCLEWNKSSIGEYEDDILEELEQSFFEMKLGYVHMLAIDKGKKAAIGKLKEIINDIQASTFTVSFDEIRSQSLLLEEEVSGDKGHVSLMFKNEVLPTLEEVVKMDMFQIRKHKNEYKLYKLESIFRHSDSLARCLNAGLINSELLLLLLVSERQKLVDMADLLQQCHQEINEEYSEFTSRMKVMQELKETCSSSPVMENPLVQCLVQLHHDVHSVNTNFHELMLNAKNLNKEIASHEGNLFDTLFNKQKSVLLRNESAIKSAEKYLCAGLTKKPILLRMEISTYCNNIEQLLRSFQKDLEQIEDNYNRKQVSFSEKPFHKEQRLLWVHFLMDPKKLVAVVTHLQELTENKMNQNMLKYQKKKKRETRFFPQGIKK